MSTNVKAAYSVEVIGFNQTERIVLSSIFGLSARREPKFLQHATVAYAPDLYLVDSADTQAVALFKARNATNSIPSIFIGDNSHGTPFPALARPLQWTKLFKAFDLAIASRGQAASVAISTMTPTQNAPQNITQNVVQNVAHHQTPSAAAPPSSPHDMRNIAAAKPALVRTQPMATITSPTPVVAPAAPQTTAPFMSAVPRNVTTPARQTLQTPPPSLLTPTTNNRDWVLVVDDNITVREFMKTKLAPFGFNVDYAESGEQAIGLTGQKKLHLCIFGCDHARRRWIPSM